MRLKHLLDSLCVDMSLQSWTVHENEKGVVCTVRFSDPPASTRVTETPHVEKWKKASNYAVKRDRDRMTRYNQNKNLGVRRSKRLESLDVEKKRDASMTEEPFFLSEPSSPVSEISSQGDIANSQLHLGAQSPEFQVDAHLHAQDQRICKRLDSPDCVEIKSPSIPVTQATPLIPEPEMSPVVDTCAQGTPPTVETPSSNVRIPISVESEPDKNSAEQIKRIQHYIQSLPPGSYLPVSDCITRQPRSACTPSTSKGTWYERRLASSRHWRKPPD